MDPTPAMMSESAKRPGKVTIGMPVYNAERFIGETVASIRTQTFEDFELIISDNASTDRTEEVCRALMKEDDRIRYVRNRENMGAAYNYNQTFHLSSGIYFKWACHDDLLLPEFLERCVAELDRDPSVVLAYTDWAPIDEDGKPLDPPEPRYPPWRADSPTRSKGPATCSGWSEGLRARSTECSAPARWGEPVCTDPCMAATTSSWLRSPSTARCTRSPSSSS